MDVPRRVESGIWNLSELVHGGSLTGWLRLTTYYLYDMLRGVHCLGLGWFVYNIKIMMVMMMRAVVDGIKEGGEGGKAGREEEIAPHPELHHRLVLTKQTVASILSTIFGPRRVSVQAGN